MTTTFVPEMTDEEAERILAEFDSMRGCTCRGVSVGAELRYLGGYRGLDLLPNGAPSPRHDAGGVLAYSSIDVDPPLLEVGPVLFELLRA